MDDTTATDREQDEAAAADATLDDELLDDELLLEEISIDGMCGVY